MGTFEELKTKEFWDAFLEEKKASGNLTYYEERAFRKFLKNEEYLNVLQGIERGDPFALPRLTELNKKHTDKKRKVFVFPRAENFFLKGVAHALHRYDGEFVGNLYSFRKSIGVKSAVADLVRNRTLPFLYGYKVDIHDYFNSVDVERLLPELQSVLIGDEALYRLIEGILKEPFALVNGERTTCKKGIMAGMPISGFLANLYLRALDQSFFARGITYARYSDDIIVFAATADEVTAYEAEIKRVLLARGLTVNERKEFRFSKGEKWDFLGFCIEGREVDLSAVALQKLKDKMRRKARALVRWKQRKGASDERAIRAFIRHFNRKLFDNPKQHEVTWCRWYFPTITTAKSLHLLDEYMVACIRYIATGRHTKANYNLRYETIKKLGYKNLVNAYFSYKKNPEAFCQNGSQE